MSEPVKIPITKGYFAVVDAVDADSVRGYKWYAREVFRPDGSLYDVKAARMEYERLGFRRYRNRQIWMHRQILGFPDPEVDHIDGDGLNNRRANLRRATRSQNMGNRRKLAAATSRFKGVCWHQNNKKWHAAVSFQKRRFSLGYFVEEADAARAYNEAALSLHGEYARLNNLAALSGQRAA